MNLDSSQPTVVAAEKSADEFELPLAHFTGTPEEKDRHWFEHYYRGDSQRQLTVRAVLMGGILGMFTAVSNLYTTLKIGWSFGVSITACVISFVAWNAICKAWNALFPRKISRMSVLENNCMQSTATAAGSSTGSTLATALGSLLLIQGVHQQWPVVAAFVFFTAALGVFLAIPMKRQMINHEQLRFPTGIATAETLRSLYSKSGESLRQAWSLIIALGAGAWRHGLGEYGPAVAGSGALMFFLALASPRAEATPYMAAQATLASRTGIFTEPAGAAALAGLVKLQQTTRALPSGQKAVLLATGNGLKDVEAPLSRISIPPAIEPELEAVPV